MNKKKAKEKKKKRKILFGRRQNPSAGALKNWSEWLKRHKRRWKRKAAFVKEEIDEKFLPPERALPEKDPPPKTTTTGTTKSRTTTVAAVAARVTPGTTTTTTTSATAATDAPTPS